MRSAFVISFTPPIDTTSGYGLRAAALLRMIATRYRVTLLLCPLGADEKAPAQADLAAEVEQYHVLDCCSPGGERRSFSELATRTREFFEAGSHDLLFVFRAEATLLALPILGKVARRIVDVDEVVGPRAAHFAELHRADGLEVLEAQQKNARALKMIEALNLSAFDRLIVDSEVEREHLRKLHPTKKIELIPNVYPQTEMVSAPRSGDPCVFFFVGSLAYPPNDDAVVWFAESIFPLIQAQTTRSVEFHVAGIGMGKRIRGLREMDGVRLLGYLPSLREAYERCHVFVVPLRAGTGTRIKILEAFAMGRPVVSTSVGAEGHNVLDGSELLIRDGEAAFAAGCLELMSSPETVGRLLVNGRRYYEKSGTEALLTERFRVIDEQWDQ